MSRTETSRASAMNERYLAVSRTPAIPRTRSRGNPVTSLATHDITSSGFETMIRIAFGDVCLMLSETCLTIPALVLSRSSRDIPGFLAIPAVTTVSYTHLRAHETPEHLV